MAARDLILEWLKEMDIEPTVRDGSFIFATGSTAVIITPDEEGAGDGYVSIECPVLIKPRVGVHLMKELLRRNSRLKIGAFALDGDYVTLSYTMPAIKGASAEFAQILRTVARAADEADDELQKLFGGKRVADATVGSANGKG